MLGYLAYEPISESLIIPVTSHRFRSQNKWKIRHLLSSYKVIYTMKIRHTVTVSINLTQNPSVWLCERGFVVCRPTDFLTGARIRSQKMWENSWTQNYQKLTRYYFKISAKKTILNPATIEYQLNDSHFSSFNGTSLMRWWVYEC